MDVLSLLHSKNRSLKRFLEFSCSFFEHAKNGDFSKLSLLIKKRDSAIKSFELYDRKINETLTQQLQYNLTSEIRDALRKVLDDKNKIIQQILEVDTKITSLIEDELKKLSLEIASSQKGKEILQKFKSTWVAENGEELDKVL